MDNSTYLIDEYVNIKDGEPYRLFPFGRLVKGGKERIIDRELASRFRLPHFKPPIKLGSHADETPAGGFIKSLEVRDDGLYAYPEHNDEGIEALAKGKWRYHSPEVIWEGFIEDSEGNMLEGPIIVGDALLHTPHLGEAAALYSIEPVREEPMEITNENVTMPPGVFEKFMAIFNREQPDEEIPAVPVEEYEAITVERDEYKSQIEAMQAAQAQAELLTAVRSEFATDEFGAAFAELGKEDEAIEMLASLDENVRNWVLTQFKALSAQINEGNLTEEIGSEAEAIDNPVEAFNQAVLAVMKEHDGLDYTAAARQVATEHPELYKGFVGK